jgi:D-alanine-D-alanine ligase
MKPLRILVLMHESLVPPESIDGLSLKQYDEIKAEFDVVQALRKAGHEVRPLGVYDKLADLRESVREWKPDIVFNLLEEFQGIAAYDQHVVAYLELLRQPYTGCNPRGLMISRDKVLSKQLLTYHRIPTPQFAVFRKGRRYRIPKKLKYPLFVKSNSEDASLGISQASIVHDAAKLKERIEFMHEQIHSDVLVEEYIEGRELYVGVLGNEQLKTFPVWELEFGKLGEVQSAIATRRVKWDRTYQDKHGIKPQAAPGLTEAQHQYLFKLSKRIYRALSISGYGRMDFRMRSDGSVYVLEANANPNLSHDEDFAQSALSEGVQYDDLLERIVRQGLGYQAAWRMTEV